VIEELADGDLLTVGNAGHPAGNVIVERQPALTD
jgi:hypothetical protein